MTQAVIFDVDGTLADIDHRRHHVEGKNKDWKQFFAMMHLDTPNLMVIKMAHLLRNSYAILICSGRNEDFRQPTVSFLRRHGVTYDKMYLRNNKDNRADHIVKKEMLDQIRNDGYQPVLVFDDRQQVVDMWRKEGLTCFQVAPGNF